MKKIKVTIFFILFSLLIIPLTKITYSSSVQNVFTHIYNTNAWPGKESYSGPGSTLKETAIIRKKIPILIQEFNIKSLLDAPCGDFNWIQYTDLSYLDQYIGLDIVPQLIQENKKNYESGIYSFMCANIINDSLPQVDAILCRDCLVHLKFLDILKTLKNIKDSGIVYLLATTFPQTQFNYDLKVTGKWRPLNLQQKPFSFPKPLRLIKEECRHDKRYPDKSLGLWKLEDIKIQEN